MEEWNKPSHRMERRFELEEHRFELEGSSVTEYRGVAMVDTCCGGQRRQHDADDSLDIRVLFDS